LCSPSNVIWGIKSRSMLWVGHVARVGHTTNTNMVLIGKLVGKGPLRRSRRRWADNIKIVLKLYSSITGY